MQTTNCSKQRHQNDGKLKRFLIVKLEQIRSNIPKQIITCSKSTIETIEKDMKYIQIKTP